MTTQANDTVCMNVDRARKMMADTGIDLLLAYGKYNVAYLTGFVQYHWYWDGIQYFMERNWLRDEAMAIAGFCLDPAKAPFLAQNAWVARNNFVYKGVEIVWDDQVQYGPIGPTGFTFPQLESTIEAIKKRGLEAARIGYDETRMPAYYLERLRKAFPRATFVYADDLLWKIRAIKTPEEIRRLREAFRIATQIYREVFAMMKPGLMLEDIQRFQMQRASELGGVWYFEHLWVHTVREPWDPPRNYRLRAGDEGGCDLGVYYQGYGCDFGRTVSLGPVHPDSRAEYDTLRAAYDAMIAACKLGNTTQDIVRAARRIEKELRGGRSAGCLGHGLGLEVHESPVIIDNWDEPLEENMVIQIEVGGTTNRNTFYFLEDAGVLTKKGWEPLTDLERDIFVVG